MSKGIKILLIEDDRTLSNDVADMLKELAEVKQVFNGADGEFEASEAPYDLIISDLMLPELNGLEIIKELRDDGNQTPVIILTAKDSLDDKVNGLNVGADDYLTKPFHREELLARVNAQLRRHGHEVGDSKIEFDDILINMDNRSLKVKGKSVPIVGKEFDILLYFAQNKNIIITKDQIFDRVWGLDSDTTTNVVNIYLNNLRRKLEKVKKGELIKTLRNVGFILETDE